MDEERLTRLAREGVLAADELGIAGDGDVYRLAALPLALLPGQRQSRVIHGLIVRVL